MRLEVRHEFIALKLFWSTGRFSLVRVFTYCPQHLEILLIATKYVKMIKNYRKRWILYPYHYLIDCQKKDDKHNGSNCGCGRAFLFMHN